MPDREKVIKEWEAVLNRDPLDAPWDLIDDTVTMLKDLEAVEPKPLGNNRFVCGACGNSLWLYHQRFCASCGQEVKWDA